MPRSSNSRLLLIILVFSLISLIAWGTYHRVVLAGTPDDSPKKELSREQADSLEARFSTQLKPFVERYCISCHGPKKQAASLDLSHDLTVSGIVKHDKQWELVLERLHASEMPPEEAKLQPKAKERAAAIAWIRELRTREAERNAGDPGPVLARRLSNAEFDNSIRDLTGFDIRPTREFPIDPANQSGFDNSGESLAMSPALLKKYLAAARQVAEHIVFKPEGFVFAPHPMVTDTDRDKYCVLRIIDFYKRHPVDYADYFLAAWKYRHREALGRGTVELSQFATESGLSPKYLALIWSLLNEPDAELGPLAALRNMWDRLPVPDKAQPNIAKPSCEHLRDLVVRLRKGLKPDVPRVQVNGISNGSQPLVLWRNRELSAKHQSYDGKVANDLPKLLKQLKFSEVALAKFFSLQGQDQEAQVRVAKDLTRFCETFPVAFVVADRGLYNANAADTGRPLTAGFHLMQGYFRDDLPLYRLILNQHEQAELDALWKELNFITNAPTRQYKDFIFFERAEPPRFMFEADFDFARSEDKDCISEAKMAKLAEAYLAKVRKQKASDQALAAIQTYFTNISAEIRWVEATCLKAEPSHLQSLLKIAERAYRRPLTSIEKDGLLAFYRALREKDDLGHEEAIRDTFAAVLLSPHFCYRFDLATPGTAARPLTDYELASRLSYFLWSSMPDGELLSLAASGDLHKPEVLKAQTQRMLRDPRVRGLATEFAGNWLDIRRFEEHNSVDRERFPQFTNELRQAMFEEPIRYFTDVVKKDRSVLDLLYGKDTFVNRTLARHYGMSEVRGSAEEWVYVEDATRYGRGGLLPMAVFLTKNAPGLRTSSGESRGYWVVRSLLGERIPPPPPTVPELPKDEAKLGDLTLPQVLARHRADKSCSGCHNRFDSVGLVFEGFGPIGELRTKDLGGKPVETLAQFPDGCEHRGLEGLRDYLRTKRQNDFIDNLSRKLLSYGLGRSLQLSDQKSLDAMKARLIEHRFAFGSLVESIVLSPQFLNKRGREEKGSEKHETR